MFCNRSVHSSNLNGYLSDMNFFIVLFTLNMKIRLIIKTCWSALIFYRNNSASFGRRKYQVPLDRDTPFKALFQCQVDEDWISTPPWSKENYNRFPLVVALSRQTHAIPAWSEQSEGLGSDNNLKNPYDCFKVPITKNNHLMGTFNKKNIGSRVHTTKNNPLERTYHEQPSSCGHIQYPTMSMRVHEETPLEL